MSAAPKWQAGKLYLPGDLVQPIKRPPSQVPTLQNPGFESGTLEGWDVEYDLPGVTQPQVRNYRPRSGVYNLSFEVPNGAAKVYVTVLNKAQPAVTPGQRITARGWVRLSFHGITGGRTILAWYDANGERIGIDEGTYFHKLANSTERWDESAVSGVAPAGAASVRAGWLLDLEGRDAADVRVDDLTWDYAGVETNDGLLYRAVQAAAGTSGSTEPNWPPVLGQQVTDNEVIWEAVSTSRVTWTASPLYVSGDTEPDWPTTVGSRVNDNGISWEAVSRRVEDEKCPNSKVVAIVASKVYAADEDIVRYSATVNPLDWSSPEDAGYLPYGLQQYGANPVAALGIYRSNLVVFNSQAFQMWQVDEDPANSALLDALPIGSTFHKALSPVSNDLFFLSAQGVRTVGIAGGSTNLAAGDVGMPIDPLVQEALAVDGAAPRATYVPSMGQYWLAMGATPATPRPPEIIGQAPDGSTESAYPPFAYEVTPGDKPVVAVRLVSGSLPPGLAISNDGVLTGAPTTTGRFSFTLHALDEDGRFGALTDTIEVYPYPIEMVEGFRSVSWDLPCVGDAGISCYVAGNDSDSFTLLGDGAQVYEVELSIFGSVESRRFAGGEIQDYPAFMKGGLPDDGVLSVYNIYTLEISNPPATYYLNHAPGSTSQRLEMDGAPLTVEIATDATVTLAADAVDGKQIKPSQWMRAEVVL